MKVSANSQSGKVLDYLIKNEHITSWEAFYKFDITRLAAVISILRDAGYDISTTIVRGSNPTGRKTHWAIYRLEGLKN